MKTARLTVEAISLWCPECGDFVPSPATGSSLLGADDLGRFACQASGLLEPGGRVTCSSCGARFRIPGRVALLER